MRTSKTLNICLILFGLCFHQIALGAKIERGDSHEGDELEEYKSTLAYYLLEREYSYQKQCNTAKEPVVPDYDVLFNLYADAINRLTQFGINDWESASKKQAIDALIEIDKTFARNGFARCVEVDSLSTAFSEPLLKKEGFIRIDLPEGDSCGLSFSPDYRLDLASRYFDIGFRPIDCDLGSILYMSIAELSSLPLSFIESPNHSFVRWRFKDGTYINWDYNDAAVYTDEDYRLAKPKSVASRRKFDKKMELGNRYLVDRTRKEIVAYYLSTMLGDNDNKECVLDLYDEVKTAEWLSPVVLNNFAWAFVSNKAFKGEQYYDQAISLAKQAVSLSPDCNKWDTLSCAYAAKKDFEKAAEIEYEKISPMSKKIAFYNSKRNCYEKEVQKAVFCPID